MAERYQQWSADGESWSGTYTAGDQYTRFTVDGGTTFSAALRFAGPTGPAGTDAAGLVSVSSLPESPVEGTAYLLTATDNTARAGKGAYLYRDGYYRAIGIPDTYAETAGAAYTIPSIMGQRLRLTLTEACALTFPPVVSGAFFDLRIPNSDTYDITWPAGLVYDGGELSDYAGDATFSVPETGGAWCLQVANSEAA